MKFVGIPIFARGNSIFWGKKKSQNECLSLFSADKYEKVTHEKALWLKVEFYYVYKKMENIIGAIFNSVIASPRLHSVSEKIGFKKAF